MRKCLSAVTAIAVLTLAIKTAHATEQIRFVSFHAPPFSISGGERPGIVREIVSEIAQRVGVPMMLEYAESAPAAIKIVQSGRNRVVFPLARTEQREPHFLWIQKTIEVPLLFASLAGKPKITTIDQVKKIQAIGVRRGFAVRDLHKRGLKNLRVANTPEENAVSLATGVIDTWYGPEAELLYSWKTTGQKDALVRGLSTRTINSYLAASKASPGIELDAWRQAFAAMVKEGAVQEIMARYVAK